MLKNYILIALRNMKRHKLYALINILGLALGLMFAVLLTGYVRDELSYDQFHPKLDRLYISTVTFRSNEFTGISSPYIGEMLKTEYPEVEAYVRFWSGLLAVRGGDRVFNRDVAFADPSFFELLAFPLARGNAATALEGRDKIVLTPEMAAQYFEDEDPMGKRVTISMGERSRDFTVTGVLEPLPTNSSIRFDFLVPFPNIDVVFNRSFEPSLVLAPFFHGTFIRLKEGARADVLASKFPAMIKKYFSDELEKYKMPKGWMRFGLYPFADYHLGTLPAGGGMQEPGTPYYSWLLAGIALMVLALACFNYVNLAVGQSAARMKEVGIRKTMGASRRQLVRHFLAEAFMMCIPALLLGLVLAEFFLPSFNRVTGKMLSLSFLAGWEYILLMPALTVVVGTLSGVYPAFVISRFQAVDIFRRRAGGQGKRMFTRALVVMQFGVSIFLMIGTLVMWRQMGFMSRWDPGYDHKDVLAVSAQRFWEGEDTGRRVLERFKNALRSHPAVRSVSGVSSRFRLPMSRGNGMTHLLEGERIDVAYKLVDPDFLKTVGIKLKQGRNLSLEHASDVGDAVLVNEAFVRAFGLSAPVGKRFYDFSSDERVEGHKYNPVIIGVVEDFHFESLHTPVGPMVLNMDGRSSANYILIRYNPGTVSQLLPVLRQLWQEVEPGKPFEVEFLDQAAARQYESERNWMAITGYSTLFALFIACMGLFGLSSLAVARRTKEVGIRKVLGAGNWGILRLISAEFTWLIGIANVIAWPAAYYFINRWLQNFAYPVENNWWIFVLAALAALSVGLLTVTLHAYRAASANPVYTLRYE